MESEKGGRSLQTFKNVIPEGSLPIYEQVAQQTGFGFKVTAEEGQAILNKSGEKIRVSPGCVEVAVTVPLGQEKSGTTPFYDAIRALKQPPKSPTG